jgi:hypothetical protein
MNHIITNGMDQDLTAVSQHQCDIAFSDLAIGDPVYKIYGALPTDTMHALRIRTMGNAVQLIFDCLTPKQKYNLDKLAQSFHKLHHQMARNFFQRQISVMVFVPCPASLLLSSLVKCFCWFVCLNLMKVGIY